jgi:hypothetical protein
MRPTAEAMAFFTEVLIMWFPFLLRPTSVVNATLCLAVFGVFGTGLASPAEVIEHDVDGANVDGAIETVGTRLEADGNATQLQDYDVRLSRGRGCCPAGAARRDRR